MVNQPGPIGTVKEIYVQFNGNDKDWEGFKTRLLAIAKKRGWKEALTKHDANVSNDVKQNAEAKNYLAFALIREAFVYFQTGELAMDVWTELCASYDEKESEDLLELMKKFDTYKCNIGMLEIYLLGYFLGLFYDTSRLKMRLDTLWCLLGNYM